MILAQVLVALQSLSCFSAGSACGYIDPPTVRQNDATSKTEVSIHLSFKPGLPALIERAEDTRKQFLRHTDYALEVLHGWYDEQTGIFASTGWWNAANCLTVIADYLAMNDEQRINYDYIFNNTLINAPKINLGQTKAFHQGRIRTFATNESIIPDGFLNGFYDDEGWWALAFIRAYEVTQDTKYLSVAADIFEDMKAGVAPCGGIWWDKKHTAQVAIANELYLSVASSLANRADALDQIGKDKFYYLSIALKQWNWFLKSGMINNNTLINDGLDDNCNNNGETVWSYNQGVILGALVELYRASPSKGYLNFALSLAHSAIEFLGENGILTDVCDSQETCGADGSQFKGVFMRNLAPLYLATKDPKIEEFIYNNAISILRNNRNKQGEMSIHWAGPFISPANASTHSSAMDALVAAVIIS